jgi:tetratricopeptide (TPR) repeat protein
MTIPPDLLQQAIQAARAGRKVEARDMLLQVVEADPHNEAAWIWLTGLVDLLEDKIIACENVLTINPSNERVRAYLSQLLERQRVEQIPPVPAQEPARVQEPLPAPVTRPSPTQEFVPDRKGIRPEEPPAEIDLRNLSRQYEAEGELEQARQALMELASVTKDSYEFDRIYREISRIESLQDENITHISPAHSIARMTFGWPLLYLALALVQVGLNPIAHPAWYLWLGLPVVLVGGFLLAIAEVRSRNPFWKTVFAEESAAGSDMARTSAAIGGWILVITPYALLLVEALNRLQTFQIPRPPY